jgi:hypothetical protein
LATATTNRTAPSKDTEALAFMKDRERAWR